MRALYMIVCLATGEEYIGSTILPLKTRWSEHLTRWKRGINSKRLQAAYDQHGLEKMELFDLGEVEDEGAEKELIRERQPALNTAYLSPRKYCVLVAKPYSPETRKRRLWQVGDEMLTMKEIKARFPHYVIERLYSGETGRRVLRPFYTR